MCVGCVMMMKGGLADKDDHLLNDQVAGGLLHNTCFHAGIFIVLIGVLLDQLMVFS